MESKNIKELDKQEFSNVRILVDLPEYDIEKDTRLLMPFSYYQHYGLMNRNGDVVVEPKYDRILDSCHNTSDVVRVGLYYTYGFNRETKEPSTYLGTKWGLIDSDGNFILEPNYKGIGVSDDNRTLTLRHMDGQYEVVTIDGEVIIPKGKYHWVDTSEKGLIRVNSFIGEEKKWGIIDASGNIILPLQYSNIWNFVGKKREWITIEVIDEHGNKRVGSFNLKTHKADF